MLTEVRLIGDCIVSAERGKYIAYASVATILGPSLSPILGGVISQYAGWHWYLLPPVFGICGTNLKVVGYSGSF